MVGKKVAGHAHGADGIRLTIDAGADSIEHGTILDEPTIAAWAKSKTYYVPTLSTVNGYKERLAANPDAYEPDVLAKIKWRIRSEEHTSELQSLMRNSYAAFCLKKKKK